MRGKPIMFKGQQVVNLAIFLMMVGTFITWIVDPGRFFFYVMVRCAFVFGMMLVLPIGAADMPVVMSLLTHTPAFLPRRPVLCSATTC